MTHTQLYQIFIARRYASAVYIVLWACGPVFVRPSIWLGAEGPGDAKSCRGTRVATSSSMRPVTTDAQQWRGLSIHAAYCYWGYGRTTGWPTYNVLF